MLCKKCGQVMSEGHGAVMANVEDGWVITGVKVLNCPSCDYTAVEVEPKE